MNVANGTRALSRWKGRNVISRTGYWSELRQGVPSFEMWPYSVDGGATENPYLRSVVRLPLTGSEQPIPVGIVSPSYALVQHRALGDFCVQTLRRLDLFYDRLRCDVELTELGEWMALRFYLGDDFSLTPPDGHPLDLRVEVFNSVDGSSRLLLALSWFRLVCSNGLIYAVLHSPAYRSRYADYLKSDFARIPVPGSKALFQELVPLGAKLVALHLLDSEAAPELKDPQSVRFAGHGEARVENKPDWSASGGNRVTVSSHRWFEGVPERVWNFHIGGYRPAQKWLKDRAAKGGKKASPGRILTAEDQLHYRRMVVAMDETIDLMAEIDRVIDKRGGWPDAFKGMSDEGEQDGKPSGS